MDNLIILDIDETLLHATKKELSQNYDFKSGPYYFYCRPHIEEFVSFCLENFLVAIWTSGNSMYAEYVANYLFGSMNKLEFVWNREQCTVVTDPHTWACAHVKDLAKIPAKYQLHKVLMIDDSPEKLIKHTNNLVRIKPFYGSDQDVELLYLILYLSSIKHEENVVTIDKSRWRRQIIEQLMAESNSQ